PHDQREQRSPEGTHEQPRPQAHPAAVPAHHRDHPTNCTFRLTSPAWRPDPRMLPGDDEDSTKIRPAVPASSSVAWFLSGRPAGAEVTSPCCCLDRELWYGPAEPVPGRIGGAPVREGECNEVDRRGTLGTAAASGIAGGWV